MSKENEIGLIILDENKNVPMNIDKLIRHINANMLVDTMEHIESLARAGCRAFEENTKNDVIQRAIIQKKVKFTAERLDPFFPMAPYIKVEKIKIKDGRKWITLKEEDDDYRIRYLDSDRRAQLLINEEVVNKKLSSFDINDLNKDPSVEVIYTTGYSLEGEDILKLPESIEYYIFSLCSSIYYGENKLNIPEEIVDLYRRVDTKKDLVSFKKQEEIYEKYSSKSKENILNGYWIK